MFSLVLLSLVSSSTALAVLPRQSGSSTFTSLPYNFTLAAVNTTLNNANTTGLPLVLGQEGPGDGAESLEVTSTYASYPYDNWPALALISSSIRAFSSDGSWYTNATDLNSTPDDGTGKAANAPLVWLTTNYYPPAISSTEYSAVQNEGDQFAHLAALGRADLWSLCPFSPDPLPLTNLVFNVTGEADPNYVGFTASECWPVMVNIVPIA